MLHATYHTDCLKHFENFLQKPWKQGGYFDRWITGESWFETAFPVPLTYASTHFTSHYWKLDSDHVDRVAYCYHRERVSDE